MKKVFSVLIVDDSLIFRIVLTNIFKDMDQFNVIGSAENGQVACEMVKEHAPDIVTLDIEMPVMDGLTAVTEILKIKPRTKIFMLSSKKRNEVFKTLSALELGAVDFIEKYRYDSKEENQEYLVGQIKSKVFLSCIASTAASSKGANLTTKFSVRSTIPRIVAIGSSTGGPNALSDILSALKKPIPIPIVIVQHTPPNFVDPLIEVLSRKSTMPIEAAGHLQSLKPGYVYIAPGGAQLAIKNIDNSPKFSLSDDPPEHFSKPSVDFMFRSVGEIFGKNAIGILLTGMGRDGASGLLSMRQQGAYTISQSEQSCLIYGMPAEAEKIGASEQVLDLNKIPDSIYELIKS